MVATDQSDALMIAHLEAKEKANHLETVGTPVNEVAIKNIRAVINVPVAVAGGGVLRKKLDEVVELPVDVAEHFARSLD